MGLVHQGKRSVWVICVELLRNCCKWQGPRLVSLGRHEKVRPAHTLHKAYAELQDIQQLSSFWLL